MRLLNPDLLKKVLALFLLPLTVLAAGIQPPSPTEEGRALLKARAYHLAMERFRQVEEKSESYIEQAMALRLIGETRFHEKEYGEAFEAYQKSLRLNPLTPSALGLEFRSAVALVYLKNYQGAVPKFRELEQRATEVETLCDLLFWEAECHFQLEHYREAQEAYTRILEEDPEYRYADLVRYLEGWCLFQVQDYGKALEAFQKARAAKPEEPLLKLSRFQEAETFFRMGKNEEAKSHYQEFMAAYPADPLQVPALYGSGWAQEKLEDLTGALASFQKILKDHPDHLLAPWAAVRVGSLATRLEKPDLAREAYAQGLGSAKGKPPADLLDFGSGWLDYADHQYEAAAKHFLTVSNFQPQSALYWDAQYLLAGCQYLSGHWDEARQIYSRLADKAPDELSKTSAYWVGWCEYAQGQYDQALAQFQKVQAKAEGEVRARSFWAGAESAYGLKQYGEAARQYQKALELGLPDALNTGCYSGLGWSYFQQEKYPEALEAFQKTAERDPGSSLGIEAQLRSGDCYYNLHQYPKAQEAYQAPSLRNAPGESGLDALEQAGWCQYRLELFSEAVKTWAELMKKPGSEVRRSRLLYWTAWAHFRSKEFEPAASGFQKVEEDYPKDSLAPEASLRYADCLFNLQKFKDSKGAYQAFLDHYSDSPLLPDALYGLQWSAEKLGEKEASSEVARSFLARFPNSPFAAGIQYRLADGLFHQEKYEDAIKAYQDLLSKYPDSPEAPRALFWEGTAQVRRGKNDEAIPVFQELLRKFPSDPLALEGQFSLGTVYFETGKFQDALGAYEGIFTRYPAHRLATHALFNSAVCEKQLRHPEKALEYFQKLLQDHADDPLAHEAGLQAGLLLEKTGQVPEALKAYEVTMASTDVNLAVEASFYHADLLKQSQRFAEARTEFNDLIKKYPDQDQWVVTSYAKIAESYESQKDYWKAEAAYRRILQYTKIKAYRVATQKRLKALEPFLKKRPKADVKKGSEP
jgi:tetratricopeptide (TPR) repeat protein